MSADTHAEQGSSWTATLIVMVLAGIGALGVWFGLSGKQAEPLDSDRVVTVETRDLLDAVSASGRVEPLSRVAVMSRASGILERFMVEEGDSVQTGQVLAELDREQLTAQLDQDRADLNSAQARVDAALARLAEARVRLDDPELGFAQREVDRLDALFGNGDISEKERDTARNAFAVVEHRLRQVTAGLPVLEASVAEANANFEAATAAVERSQTALSEATIRSSITGIVLRRLKEVGDGVSSILTAGGNATQILELGDLSDMFVEARVDEVDLGRIHAGMPAVIIVDAHRDRPLDGSVLRVAPAGSVDANGIVTFEVRLAVEDPDGLLRSDMTADARLVVARRDAVPALPQRAFTRSAQGWTVKLVRSLDPPDVEERAVQLGLGDGLWTEITAGLTVGDRVLLPGSGTGRGGGP